MLGAVRIVRGANVAVSFAGTIVGALAAVTFRLPFPSSRALLIVLAAASAGLVTAGGNVLNDLGDLEGDRVNHPERPLVTGEISTRSARRLTAGLFVAGAALAAPVAWAQPAVAVLLAVAVAGLVGYELRFKARGLVGNVTVGGLTAMVFLYGGAAVGAPLTVAPFAAMAFLATLSREVIKDMEDVRGDVRRTTLPRTRGPLVASGLARGAIVAAVALSAVPLAWFVRGSSPSGVAYLVLVGAADAMFLASVALLPRQLRLEQRMSKGAMAVALCAFLAVAFR